MFEFLKNLEITNGVWTDFSEVEDIYNFIMVIVCVVCAGLAAGLTVGLLSLDITKLEIKMMIGTEKEKEAVYSLLPIVKRHHLLLVTLLLFNSIANETLPIFLGALVPNYVAVILSVTLVLIFGEIIPSALFTGPDQLLTAASLTNLVYFLLVLFYPISYPISKVLDYLFGSEENTGSMSREELEALVLLQGEKKEQLQLESENTPLMESKSFSQTVYNSLTGSPMRPKRDKNQNNNNNNNNNNHNNNNHNNNHDNHHHKPSIALSSDHSPAPGLQKHESESLSQSEVSLMTGILKLSKFTVRDTMIPIKRVSMISSSTRLDEKSLYDILDSGFSRIPVYKRHDKQHVMGYILVKELIVINPIDNVMIENLKLREPLCVKPNIDLMDLLSLFQEGHCHLAVVTPNPLKTLECMRNGTRPTEKEAIMGIVTMEDVLEKMIQREIVDETDFSPRRGPGLAGNVVNPTMLLFNPTTRNRRNSLPANFNGAAGAGLGQRHASSSRGNQHRRPRIFAAGSVVTSDYYLANQVEHFGLPEKEDVVMTNPNYADFFTKTDSQKSATDHLPEGIPTTPPRGTGQDGSQAGSYQQSYHQRAYPRDYLVEFSDSDGTPRDDYRHRQHRPLSVDKV